jgi:hypothetical protein
MIFSILASLLYFFMYVLRFNFDIFLKEVIVDIALILLANLINFHISASRQIYSDQVFELGSLQTLYQDFIYFSTYVV